MEPKTLGARIKQARIAREWTQDQLAARCDVSRSVISQWETGVVQEISASHLYAAAKALRVSLDWLLEGASPDAEPSHHDAEEVIALWSSLTASQRLRVVEEVREMASHNRALLAELGRLK